MGFDFEIGEERVPGFLKSGNREGPDGQPAPPSKCQIALRVTGTLIGHAIAIFMIVIGAKNNDNCPAEPMVPIFLMVTGSLTLVSSFLGFINFLTMLAWVKKRLSGVAMVMELAFVSWLQLILGVISIIWFIAGSAYVFKAYQPDFLHENSPRYCDERTYDFAFYFLCISYALMGLAIAVGCCFCVVACCAGSLAACFKSRN